MLRLCTVSLALIATIGCQEYTVTQEPPPPPAEPPGIDVDAEGEPPADWNNCSSGFYGLYFNLPANHPLIGAAAEDTDIGGDTDPTTPPILNPDLVDFWTADYLAFSRYDPSLEYGANWWPVDDGLADDPRYFAVQWTAWMRVWSHTQVTLLLGAEDDAWIYIQDNPAVAVNASAFAPTTYTVDLQPGQYPVRIRYAQRVGEQNGFRFRLVSGDAKICYPEFPPPDTDN